MRTFIDSLIKNSRHAKLVSASQSLPEFIKSLPIFTSRATCVAPLSRPSHTLSLGEGRKCAFTLAETLITLGIIGVVAALTISSIVSKYQEKMWLSKFKKNYNTISNAYARAYEEYGIANNWGVSEENGTQKVFNILSQYINVAVDSPDLSNRRCSELDKRITSASNNCFLYQNSYNFITQDGTIISIGKDKYKAPLITIDTNGFSKPNTLGKDIFILYLNARNDNPIVTGLPEYWFPNSTILCSRFNKEGSWTQGITCTSWIIATDNMDYLHRELSQDEYKNAIKNLVFSNANADQLK